ASGALVDEDEKAKILTGLVEDYFAPALEEESQEEILLLFIQLGRTESAKDLLMELTQLPEDTRIRGVRAALFAQRGQAATPRMVGALIDLLNDLREGGVGLYTRIANILERACQTSSAPEVALALIERLKDPNEDRYEDILPTDELGVQEAVLRALLSMP